MPRSVNGRAKVTVSRLVRRSIVPLHGARAPRRAAPPRHVAMMLLDGRRAGHRHLQGGEILAAEPGRPVARLDLVGHGRPAALLDERGAVPAAERLQRHQLGRRIGRCPEAVHAHGRRELVARAERRLLGRGPRRAAGRPPAPGEADDDGRDGAPRARPERQGLGRPAGLPALPQALLGGHHPSPSLCRRSGRPGVAAAGSAPSRADLLRPPRSRGVAGPRHAARAEDRPRSGWLSVRAAIVTAGAVATGRPELLVEPPEHTFRGASRRQVALARGRLERPVVDEAAEVAVAELPVLPARQEERPPHPGHGVRRRVRPGRRRADEEELLEALEAVSRLVDRDTQALGVSGQEGLATVGHDLRHAPGRPPDSYVAHGSRPPSEVTPVLAAWRDACRTELPPWRTRSMSAAAPSWSPAAPSASGAAARWAAAASARIARASASSMISFSVSESSIDSHTESAASPAAPEPPSMGSSFRDRRARPGAVAAGARRRQKCRSVTDRDRRRADPDQHGTALAFCNKDSNHKNMIVLRFIVVRPRDYSVIVREGHVRPQAGGPPAW